MSNQINEGPNAPVAPAAGTPAPVGGPGPVRKRIRMGTAAMPLTGAALLALVAAWIFGLLPHHGGGSIGIGTPNDSSQPPSAQSQNVATPPQPDKTVAFANTPLLGSPLLSQANNLIPTAASAVAVTVNGDDYQVNGKSVEVPQLVANAKAALAAGVATPIKIVTGPQSRIGAERNLEQALDLAQVPFTHVDTSSTTQP